jgi:hypothetical protein
MNFSLPVNLGWSPIARNVAKVSIVPGSSRTDFFAIQTAEVESRLRSDSTSRGATNSETMEKTILLMNYLSREPYFGGGLCY